MLIEANIKQACSEVDPFTHERYAQFSKYLRDGSNVLDVGCNTGRGGSMLKKMFPSIKLYGVDLVKERLGLIPTGLYEQTQACSIEDAIFSDDFFDFVLAGELIEHLPDDILNSFLNRCRCFLKKGGSLILTTPNPHSFLVLLGKKDVFHDPSHVNVMSASKAKRIIEKHGFFIKSIKGSGKASRYIGDSFPIFPLYGSYLVLAEKKA